MAHQASSGQTVGSHDLGPGWAAGPPIPLFVAGQPAPLVGVDWRVEGVQIAQRAVSFASNTVVWSAPPFAFGGFYASGAGDLDGDGTSEWYYVTDVLHRRNAATGQLESFPGLSTGYSIPMVADFMGSQDPDLLLQSGVTSLDDLGRCTDELLTSLPGVDAAGAAAIRRRASELETERAAEEARAAAELAAEAEAGTRTDGVR